MSRHKPEDIWRILSSIGGIATAVVVAIIGIIGSCTINRQQEQSRESELYLQLISQREQAESKVRSDMFNEIVSSFLGAKPGTDCLIDDIEKQLLRLDLLARNFHETVDMEPLFRHVLLKIVRGIKSLEQPPNDELKSWKCDRELRARWKKIDPPETWDEFTGNLKRQKLDRLKTIAKRVTTKQKESLMNAKVRSWEISINLSDTCQDKAPIDAPLDSSDCKITGISEKSPPGFQIEGLEPRNFTVSVNRSYPDWSQIWVQVKVEKTKQEKLDNKCKDTDEKCKDEDKFTVSEFWLSYFDFPLTENTFLSDEERYSVILDDIKKNEAHITLLYFPASYAGLKEKSFYQQKLINNLITHGSLMH